MDILEDWGRSTGLNTKNKVKSVRMVGSTYKLRSNKLDIEKAKEYR
jgi:hypothetical protein